MSGYFGERSPVDPFVFIVGSPRSGTTILAEVLDRHPSIAQWYEPYFIWDRHFRNALDDCRGAEDATEEVRQWIRGAFEAYRKARGVDLVVDKSPRNCLKLPFVKAIFPEAAFIFLYRDGRDAILSIHREWLRRRGILGNRRRGMRWRDVIGVILTWMNRQLFWRHRLQAFLFELGRPRLWFRGEFLHRIRWDGRVGWGPRFQGWQELIDRVSTLEFNAHQWVRCVDGILREQPSIPKDRCILLKYEDFIEDPESSLRALFSSLRVEFPAEYMEKLPEIRAGNFNKWRQAFSEDDLRVLGPIIGKALIHLGYETDESWYLDFRS